VLWFFGTLQRWLQLLNLFFVSLRFALLFAVPRAAITNPARNAARDARRFPTEKSTTHGFPGIVPGRSYGCFTRALRFFSGWWWWSGDAGECDGDGECSHRRRSARRGMPAACCLLPAACCLLPAACCLLPAACCLLPAACCPCPQPATHTHMMNAHRIQMSDSGLTSS
jgi:hypothetical protein